VIMPRMPSSTPSTVRKNNVEALLGAVAQLRQKFAVVFEVDAQHDWDAEHELSMGDGIEDVVGDVFPELNGFLGVAAGTEPPALA